MIVEKPRAQVIGELVLAIRQHCFQRTYLNGQEWEKRMTQAIETTLGPEYPTQAAQLADGRRAIVIAGQAES